MAHNNLVDGTSYATKGGKCLVDGTGYSVLKGRTLIDGTGYDINLVTDYPVTIDITGAGDATAFYVTINGKQYSEATSGIGANPGDVITFTYGDPYTMLSLYVGVDTIMYFPPENSVEWTVPDGVEHIRLELAVGESDAAVTIKYLTEVTVDITGTGHETYGYLIINGVKYTEAASGIIVYNGDAITYSGSRAMWVTENGSGGYKNAGTYTWTVPDGVSHVAITLQFNGTLVGIDFTTS